MYKISYKLFLFTFWLSYLYNFYIINYENKTIVKKLDDDLFISYYMTDYLMTVIKMMRMMITVTIS